MTTRCLIGVFVDGPRSSAETIAADIVNAAVRQPKRIGYFIWYPVDPKTKKIGPGGCHIRREQASHKMVV
jgi:hypothetical protein